MKTVEYCQCEVCGKVIQPMTGDCVIFEGKLYNPNKPDELFKDTLENKWAICGTCFRNWFSWDRPQAHR